MSSLLVRIRFPRGVVSRLDEMAEALRLKVKREVPRAALVRALLAVSLEAALDDPRLLAALAGDVVKRGLPAGARRPPAKAQCNLTAT